MTEYQPGTVAVATVRGVKGVRVMRYAKHTWVTGEPVEGRCAYAEHNVTDIRPLVVLDLEQIYPCETFTRRTFDWSYVVRLLRNADSSAIITRAHIADQIEAQTKSVRIPEPGLWGVVRDDMGYVWLHDFETAWTKVGTNEQSEWDEITHPELIHEGLS